MSNVAQEIPEFKTKGAENNDFPIRLTVFPDRFASDQFQIDFPSLNKLAVLVGHATASRCFRLAKAMILDLTKLETSGDGSNAVLSQSAGLSWPNLSRNR